MGGGGWMMQEEQSPLDRFALSLIEKDKPNLCLLATACGDAAHIVERFYASELAALSNPSDLSFFRTSLNWQDHLKKQDIIYVGGGNTRTMLAIWREWGVDQVLREAYHSGALICGMSAGAICWFEFGWTDSNPGNLSPLKCLGVLPGSCCPHYNQEEHRRASFQRAVDNDEIPAGYGLDDRVGIHFINEQPVKVIKSNAENNAYFVRKNKDQIFSV